MLRKLIESNIGPITDEEFKLVMDAMTADIMYNHIGYKVKTDFAYVLNMSIVTVAVVRR